MSKRQVNVALLGYKFMGKAHSQAWREVTQFFDPGLQPVLKVVCGRHAEPLREFASRWGWQETSTDWESVVARPDIDIVDIATPTATHYPMAKAAIAAGKAVFCEKPFMLTVAEAEEIAALAEARGILHYLNHNYRRVPAIAYARRLIEEGRLGRLYHWNGCYLQDWILDPEFPLTWQLRAETAGAGPHYDLNSHSVDLAHYLVGDITEVQAMDARFVTERPVAAEVGETAFGTVNAAGRPKAPVTVDDACFMVVRFAQGALGSFKASRFAAGRKNYNMFEIYGEKGALRFNLERLNELEFYDATAPAAEAGFRVIQTTESAHPYVAAWWPPGHIIGYEHTFVHAVYDFLHALQTGARLQPDFHDGVKILKVLRAGLQSAAQGVRISL